MACNVNLPLTDIIDEVLSKLDLDSKLDAVGGIATDLTLKGDVVLDSDAKAALCQQLSSCLGEKISSVELVGENLLITTNKGGLFTVDLSKFFTDEEARRLKNQLDNVISDKSLVHSQLDGDVLTITQADGTQVTVNLSGLSGNGELAGAALDGNTLVLTLTSGEKKRVDLSSLVSPKGVKDITFSNNVIKVTKDDGTVTTIDLSAYERQQIRTGGGIVGSGTATDPLRIEGWGEPCVQKVKTVGTYTATVTDEVLLAGGGTITLPATLPEGKVFTIIRTGTDEVILEGQPRLIGGGTKPKSAHSAVSAIRTGDGWYLLGDLA